MKIMKTVLLLFLLIPIQLFSQEKYIELKNNETGKIDKISENKQVKIITNDKHAYFGRVQIIDSATIEIKKILIKLEDIYSIKNKSLGKTITSSSLIFLGSVSLVVSPFAVLAGEMTVAAITGSTGLTAIIVGIVLPKINKNHKNEKWTYKIVY